MRPYDQLAMTPAPMMPARGSIQSQPNPSQQQADNYKHKDGGIVQEHG
jgi:hypothetical protein